jgi:hypothetical protein
LNEALSQDQNQNQISSTIIDKLRLYCEGIKIRSNRYKILPYENRYHYYTKAPINTDDTHYREIETQLLQIRSQLIDRLMNEIEDRTRCDLEKNVIAIKKIINIYLKTHPTGTLISNVIKLGSTSESHKNIKVNEIQDMNRILTDYRYNNTDNKGYYNSNMLLCFNCLIVDNISGTNPSCAYLNISPIISEMEIYYNKAKCISTMKTNEKFTLIDTTLVL